MSTHSKVITQTDTQTHTNTRHDENITSTAYAWGNEISHLFWGWSHKPSQTILGLNYKSLATMLIASCIASMHHYRTRDRHQCVSPHLKQNKATTNLPIHHYIHQYSTYVRFEAYLVTVFYGCPQNKHEIFLIWPLNDRKRGVPTQ